jgi:hypothetical protein
MNGVAYSPECILEQQFQRFLGLGASVQGESWFCEYRESEYRVYSGWNASLEMVS